MVGRSPPTFTAIDLIFDRYQITFKFFLTAGSDVYFDVNVRDLVNNYLVAEVGKISLRGLAQALIKITASNEKVSLNSTKGSIRLSQRLLRFPDQPIQTLQIEFLDVGFFQPICISDQETSSNLRGFLEKMIVKLPPAPPEAERPGLKEVQTLSQDTTEGGDQNDDTTAGFDFLI